MLAKLAKQQFASTDNMHCVWEIIEWIGNTLIFLIAGLIIGHRILSEVFAIDWLYVLLLYVFLNVIRTITVILLFPFLDVSISEAIFISWSGMYVHDRTIITKYPQLCTYIL